MRATIAIAICAFLLGFGAQPVSAATGGQFSVGVQVLASRPADRDLLASIPAPANAVLIAANAASRHHAYAGTLTQATDFYRERLLAAGWRLLQWRGDGEQALEQVWEGRHGRLLLRLQAALGSVPATRISLAASAVRGL